MQLEHQPEIIKLKDPEEVAYFVVTQIIALVNHKANAVITIPTGKTPARTYEMLVEAVQNGEVSFDEVTLRMLDEYQWLERKDPRTFQNQLRKLLINPIHFPDVRFQTIASYSEDGSPEEADRYENLISTIPSDMVILGIGQNGHIGFNEPLSPFNSGTRLVTLSDSTLNANKKDLKKSGRYRYIPGYAITQGIGNILEANRIVMMATGESKAGIIRQTLKGEISTDVPASALRTRQNVLFVLDRAAASLL